MVSLKRRNVTETDNESDASKIFNTFWQSLHNLLSKTECFGSYRIQPNRLNNRTNLANAHILRGNGADAQMNGVVYGSFTQTMTRFVRHYVHFDLQQTTGNRIYKHCQTITCNGCQNECKTSIFTQSCF